MVNRIENTIRNADFFQELKRKYLNLRKRILELEYRNDMTEINEELGLIKDRLDALETDMVILQNKASQAQVILGSLDDRITALEPKPEII